jgi:hypothetical protein
MKYTMTIRINPDESYVKVSQHDDNKELARFSTELEAEAFIIRLIRKEKLNKIKNRIYNR